MNSYPEYPAARDLPSEGELKIRAIESCILEWLEGPTPPDLARTRKRRLYGARQILDHDERIRAEHIREAARRLYRHSILTEREAAYFGA